MTKTKIFAALIVLTLFSFAGLAQSCSAACQAQGYFTGACLPTGDGGGLQCCCQPDGGAPYCISCCSPGGNLQAEPISTHLSAKEMQAISAGFLPMSIGVPTTVETNAEKPKPLMTTS